MMSSNSDAEAALNPSQNSNWWLLRWSSWLATIGALVLALFGFITMIFSIISPLCMIAGALQICAAGIILAVEGSSVVVFLTFAKPVGMYFDGKPVWFKTAVYAGLTIVPCLTGCSGVAFIFGVLISAGITSLYGMILVGKKADFDDMRAAATMPA